MCGDPARQLPCKGLERLASEVVVDLAVETGSCLRTMETAMERKAVSRKCQDAGHWPYLCCDAPWKKSAKIAIQG